MKIYTTKRPVRKKIQYVGDVGFKRRTKWSRPFVVAVYQVQLCGVSA